MVLSEALPTAQEYIALRDAMGWGRLDEATARRTLDAAAYTVCLRDGEAGGGGRLAGLARVMGDGTLYFFLADLIVAPEARGGGHGETLMRAVVDYFDRAAQPNATITLVAMPGREAFYERFGFRRTPDGPFGHGMRYAGDAKAPPLNRP
ncbi:MAG: GNAT family N-acetyltransferase [Alphaproteobacteria bacterium]|nr:GNAT family N-acetyltransferase [Alphaproteobacteria bacterium]